MQNRESLEFQALAQKEKNIVGKLILQKMSVEDYMADYRLGHPSLYVGTYGKYNSELGIWGMWVDLVECGDYDTFMEVCHKLHADEENPEFQFSDYENFPECWYSESCIDKATFDKIIEYAGLSEDEQEAYEAFLDSFNEEGIDTFRDRYMGKWDSEVAFAEHLVDECYDLEAMMGRLAYFFDYEHFSHEIFLEDYYYTDGFVFRRY